MRSAQGRRETYVGPRIPEPLLTSTDDADEVAATDAVSMALLVVLETLAPLERWRSFDRSYRRVAWIAAGATPGPDAPGMTIMVTRRASR
ncbi:hypothetical protein [Micromonospora sp. CPCC 205739]|uniref:hypothetical protein n=1 Tax=unclassified Micromonospora TaxID=2617518 RepID=UPI003FA52949